jgi:MFS family permease
VLVPDYDAWLLGAVLQGAGTAMVYPTLLAAIADHAHPLWRASSLGVYRFWRDLGYAIGALLSGVIADALSVAAAIHTVAAITLASGLVALALSPRRIRRNGPVRAPGTDSPGRSDSGSSRSTAA